MATANQIPVFNLNTSRILTDSTNVLEASIRLALVYRQHIIASYRNFASYYKRIVLSYMTGNLKTVREKLSIHICCS
jgi:hypothetical protein